MAKKTYLLASARSLAFAEAGWQDYHCHGDRAFTYHDRYFEHESGGLNEYIDASLSVKQDAMGVLHHGVAYTDESLNERLVRLIEAKIAAKESMVNIITDCSPDVKGRAFEMGLRIRRKYAPRIEINIGAYSVFGFERYGSEYHRHLAALAPRAQFLVGLPERDDKPNHPVGYDGHLAILIELAKKHGIPLHVHIDQTGLPNEGGTERFIQAIHWLMVNVPKEKRPKIYAVHELSLSAQDEQTFWKNAAALKHYNIGVVVCPHATLGNRQIRSAMVPMRNSITRVKELLLCGIDLRFGTDNINDLFMPTPLSPLLAREIGREYGSIQSIIRFYDATVLHKIASGIRLNKTDLARIEKSVKDDYSAAGWYGQRPWRNLGDFLKL